MMNPANLALRSVVIHLKNLIYGKNYHSFWRRRIY